MTRVSPPRLFPWVQVLRATAAAAVAWEHIAHDAIAAGHDPAGWIATALGVLPWTAGVDVFFVISGFVIVHASGRLFAAPRGWLTFLRRRLTRIAPLYWGLTTLLLATTLVDRRAVHGALGDAWYIAASYLFIPVARPDGLVQPALSLGWTLNYEMFFYLLMTPFLLLPRSSAVALCAATLGTLVLAGQAHLSAAVPFVFWSNPVVLEFAAGMGLAQAVAHGMRLPLWLRLALVAIALAALHLDTVLGRTSGLVEVGIPAVLLVCATVSGDGGQPRGRALRLGVRLGDASYAMYLVHPFVMRALTILGAHLQGLGEWAGVGYVAVSLGLAQAVALAINIGVERRFTRLLRRWV
jgi:exopolysaccharide production protein ExoZ